jgi:hypothetical protein
LKRLVTFLVLLCSISPVVPRKDPHAPPGFIEPELQAYVDAFYADCAKACAPFKDSMLSVQGVRGQMVYNGTSVTGLALVSFSLYGIRRVVYVRMDDRGPYTVKATVYHELMHALFYASHVARAYREIPAWSLLDEWDAADEAFYRNNWNDLARTDFCRLTDQYKGVPCKLLRAPK